MPSRRLATLAEIQAVTSASNEADVKMARDEKIVDGNNGRVIDVCIGMCIAREVCRRRLVMLSASSDLCMPTPRPWRG